MGEENHNLNELWSEVRRIDKIVVRIDERTSSMAGDVSRLAEEKVNLDRFSPVEKLAYGAAALILSAVCGGLLTLLLKT